MNLDLLGILACPGCAGPLQAVGVVPGQPTLDEGGLRCDACGRTWPVVRGIPRLMAGPPAGEAALTAEGFGRSWRACDQLASVDRQQFLDWIHPVGQDFFRGKRVLDLGCGKGRHAVLASEFGASRVVAVDFSDAVEVARDHTRHLPNVDVVQADLLNLPFRPGTFDYAWCVGVLHHLPVPAEGFRALIRQVRPGGHASAWVYAWEGNGWIIALVDPLRRLLRQAPFPLVRALSRVLASLLFMIVQGVYVPVQALAPGLARRLFYADYMLALAPHRFSGVESIVLDQLIAPVTHYIRRSQFMDWFAGLEEVRTSWLHANSWRGFGRIPEEGLPEETQRRR